MRTPMLVIATSAVIGLPELATGEDSLAVPYDAALQKIAAFPNQRHLKTHRDCARRAETRQLSHSEETACLDAYQRLKLSFLSDVGFEEFLLSSPAECWIINQRAYAAY